MTALRQKLIDVETAQVGGQAVNHWIGLASSDQPAYLKLLDDSKDARTRDLAGFADAVRKKAVALLVAAEAADTRGYDVDTDSIKEIRQTLLDRRTEIRDAYQSLDRISREVSAALPPAPNRLEELKTTFAGVAVPDVAWAEETRQMAQHIESAAKTARREFEARQTKLGAADEEAQWFVCTDASGAPLTFEEGVRDQLTYQGKTPFRTDDPQNKKAFLNNNPDTDKDWGTVLHKPEGILVLHQAQATSDKKTDYK